MTDVSLTPKDESEMYSQTELWVGLLVHQWCRVKISKKSNLTSLIQSENLFPLGHILLIQSGSQDTKAQTVGEVRWM